MAKFDRYILGQMLVLFGFFALVLVLIYWINRAVVLFDQLISNGESAMVFLEFTALTIPNIIRITMQIAGFVAVIWGVNTLHSDSELVIVQATGFSPWRLARPFLVFGTILVLMSAVLSHALAPASLGRLSQRQVEIRADASLKQIEERAFVHPGNGLTIYIGYFDARGVARDIFMHDNSNPNVPITYSARSAVLLRNGNSLVLTLQNGMAQTINKTNGQFATAGFDNFDVDLSDLLQSGASNRKKPREIPSLDILRDIDAAATLAKVTPDRMSRELHIRNANSLLAVIFVALGYAALMIGGFSRFGLWRQIAFAVTLGVLLQSVHDQIVSSVVIDQLDWYMVYAVPVVGALLFFVLLWVAGRPDLFLSRRARREARA